MSQLPRRIHLGRRRLVTIGVDTGTGRDPWPSIAAGTGVVPTLALETTVRITYDGPAKHWFLKCVLQRKAPTEGFVAKGSLRWFLRELVRWAGRQR